MTSEAFLTCMWALDVALWVGVAFGVFIDVVSCRAHVRRRRSGRGPSGVPIVALCLFLLRILVRPLDFASRVHRPWWLLACAVIVAFAFHLSCQVLIPWSVRKSATL